MKKIFSIVIAVFSFSIQLNAQQNCFPVDSCPYPNCCYENILSCTGQWSSRLDTITVTSCPDCIFEITSCTRIANCQGLTEYQYWFHSMRALTSECWYCYDTLNFAQAVTEGIHIYLEIIKEEIPTSSFVRLGLFSCWRAYNYGGQVPPPNYTLGFCDNDILCCQYLYLKGEEDLTLVNSILNEETCWSNLPPFDWYCINICESNGFLYRKNIDFNENSNFPFSSQLLPNPTKGLIELLLKGDLQGQFDFRILNIEGKIVYRRLLTKYSTEFKSQYDISQLSSGIYQYVIIFDNNLHSNGKFVIQK